MADETPPPHEQSDEEILASCRIDVFRAGGKGGQHQNTTNTGVRLVHRPTGTRAESRTERSQSANRRRALARLREKLAAAVHRDPPRKTTRVPAAERRRRLEDKKRRADRKRLRRPPSHDD